MFVTHSHKNNLNRMWGVQIIFCLSHCFCFCLWSTHPRLGPRLGEGTSFYVASPENKEE